MTQRAAWNGEGGEETYMGQGDRCGSAVWKNHSERCASFQAHITSIQFHIPPSLQYTYSFLFIVLIFSRLSSLLVSTNLKKGNMSHKSNGEVKETKYIQCNLLYNEDWQEGRQRERERENTLDLMMRWIKIGWITFIAEWIHRWNRTGGRFRTQSPTNCSFYCICIYSSFFSLFSLCFWVCHHFNFILIRFALTSKSTVKWVGVVFVVVEPWPTDKWAGAACYACTPTLWYPALGDNWICPTDSSK